MFKAVLAQAARFVQAGVLGAAVMACATSLQARTPQGEAALAQATPTIALSELPVQGRTTYARIHEGGPFPYDKDGSVFGNRERLLPRQPRGYWLEYTVKTPSVRHRGARRIVCGGAPRQPDACYYTADHYASFRKIVP